MSLVKCLHIIFLITFSISSIASDLSVNESDTITKMLVEYTNALSNKRYMDTANIFYKKDLIKFQNLMLTLKPLAKQNRNENITESIDKYYGKTLSIEDLRKISPKRFYILSFFGDKIKHKEEQPEMHFRFEIISMEKEQGRYIVKYNNLATINSKNMSRIETQVFIKSEDGLKMRIPERLFEKLERFINKYGS